MIWSFLIIGILLSGFAVIMFWREALLNTDVSLTRLALLVWLPGMIGGMAFASFWILLIATLIKRM